MTRSRGRKGPGDIDSHIEALIDDLKARLGEKLVYPDLLRWEYAFVNDLIGPRIEIRLIGASVVDSEKPS